MQILLRLVAALWRYLFLDRKIQTIIADSVSDKMHVGTGVAFVG